MGGNLAGLTMIAKKTIYMVQPTSFVCEQSNWQGGRCKRVKSDMFNVTAFETYEFEAANAGPSLPDEVPDQVQREGPLLHCMSLTNENIHQSFHEQSQISS